MKMTKAATALVMGLIAAGPAAAQTDPDSSVTLYPAESFADSAPANAADMLRYVPGFTLVEADADVRGYAGAQGNVLIDGVRPASKREDIDDLLERIPAASVERIELIHNGRPGIDMAGYPVLANIVRRRGATVEGAVEGGLIVSTDGWVAPRGQVEYARRWGEHALELALTIDPGLDDDTGRGTIRATTPDGVRIEESRLDTRTIKDEAEASASWRQPLGSGQLTATAALRGEAARTDTEIVTPGPVAGREVVDESEDFVEAEIGARYARELGDRSTLELVATQQLGWLEAAELSIEDGEEEKFHETTETGETIGRIQLTHERSGALSLTAGLEGAFNFLDGEARLVEDGLPVSLPGSDVRIEERRVEGSAGATWTPAAAWIIEASLRVERSAIAQTGDSPLERRFAYAKPRLAASWDVDDRNQLRLSLSREVGQLDFGDFVASASLETDVVTAGNARLEPDKTWRLTAAWERHFWSDAALTLTWTHDEIADVIDRVLVVTPDDLFDAPGNIGDGRRDAIALDLAAPLDRFGFPGGHIRSSLLWRTSEVTDPVTGEARPISEEAPVEGSVILTQDLPLLGLNWGVEIEHIGEQETEYRFDEIARSSEGVGWTVFVERRIGERWRLRAEATDLFGRDFVGRRELYDGPRSTYPIEEIERRDRETPGYVSLTLRRNMGG